MESPGRLLERFGGATGAAPPTVVVAAHPGDEVLGAGARLSQNDPVLIVHGTDGSPVDLREARAAGCSSREEYAVVRRTEAARALRAGKIDASVTRQLGIRDQEASYNLVHLTRALTGILLEAAPELVLTHPYEGGHPDHDAIAFAVAGACQLLRRLPAPVPIIVEFPGYHDHHGQPRAGEFLQRPAAGPESVHVLSDQERQLKRDMLDHLASQRSMLELFPVEVERFRLAPPYDFGVPPHPGTLLYERFSWRMTGRLWRSLAADAARELNLQGICSRCDT